MDEDPDRYMPLLYLENDDPRGMKFPMKIWKSMLALCTWAYIFNICAASVATWMDGYEWLSQPILVIVGFWVILFTLLNIMAFYPATPFDRSPVGGMDTHRNLHLHVDFVYLHLSLCAGGDTQGWTIRSAFPSTLAIRRDGPPGLHFLLLAASYLYLLVLTYLDECQRIVKFCACRYT